MIDLGVMENELEEIIVKEKLDLNDEIKVSRNHNNELDFEYVKAVKWSEWVNEKPKENSEYEEKTLYNYQVSKIYFTDWSSWATKFDRGNLILNSREVIKEETENRDLYRFRDKQWKWFTITNELYCIAGSEGKRPDEKGRWIRAWGYDELNNSAYCLEKRDNLELLSSTKCGARGSYENETMDLYYVIKDTKCGVYCRDNDNKEKECYTEYLYTQSQPTYCVKNLPEDERFEATLPVWPKECIRIVKDYCIGFHWCKYVPTKNYTSKYLTDPPKKYFNKDVLSERFTNWSNWSVEEPAHFDYREIQKQVETRNRFLISEWSGNILGEYVTKQEIEKKLNISVEELNKTLDKRLIKKTLYRYKVQ
jgi:hypothetical protein